MKDCEENYYCMTLPNHAQYVRLVLRVKAMAPKLTPYTLSQVYLSLQQPDPVNNVCHMP